MITDNNYNQLKTLLIFILTTFNMSVYAQIILNKTYLDMYKKSIWEYEFHATETFWYRSQGLTGNRESTGRYNIVGDSVVLNSVETDTTKWKFKKLINKKLLTLPDTCLLDLRTGSDYCIKYFISYGDSILIQPSTRRFKPSKAFQKNN